MKNFGVNPAFRLPLRQSIFSFSSILCAGILLITAPPPQATFAQAVPTRPKQNGSTKSSDQTRAGESSAIEVIHVQGNVSMLAGAGGNIPARPAMTVSCWWIQAPPQ